MNSFSPGAALLLLVVPAALAGAGAEATYTIRSREPVVAGALATLDFRILSPGMAAGDTLEVRSPLAGPHRRMRWEKPTPETCVFEGAEARLEIVVPEAEIVCPDVTPLLMTAYPRRILVHLEEAVPEGRELELTFGPARAQMSPQSPVEFPVRLLPADGSGRRLFERTGAPLEVGRAPARRLHLTGPSRVPRDAPTTFRIAALDTAGFEADGSPHEIELVAKHESGETAGPFPVSPQAPNDVAVTLFEVRLPREGAWWLRAAADGVRGGWELPVVAEEAGDRRLAWGDLHWQSNHTDGARFPEQGFHYAREIAGLDFTCKTDHDFHGLFPCLDEDKWNESIELAREWEEPGRFAALLGWEWTSGRGHQNVYFPDLDVDLVSSGWSDVPDSLWNRLPEGRAITIPHHPTAIQQPPTQWKYHDERFQTVVEIYSNKGNAEKPVGPLMMRRKGEDAENVAPRETSVQQGLSLGRRFWLIASTDNHYSAPGTPVRVSGLFKKDFDAGPGLCAVWIDDLDRASVWRALRDGRAYGTTGPRIRVEWSGSFDEGAVLRGRVIAADALDSVVIVGIPYDGKPPFPELPLELGDHERVLRFEHRAKSLENGEWRGAYLRVTQRDGEMAWSSPIYVP